MPDNLGKVVRCESHVTTRLRYVRKSMAISGSLIREETLVSLEQHSVSVHSVTIDLSVPNGESITNDTESGVVLSPNREKIFANVER